MTTTNASSLQETRTIDRIQVLLAAVLWSLSGWFSKLLTLPTSFHLNSPELDPLVIASLRVLFGGLVLAPLIRPADIRFSWGILFTALIFTAMSATFLIATVQGKSANAVLLQYTAPMWLYFAGITFLKEPTEWRANVSLWAGVAGIALIVAGGWQEGQAKAMGLALFSGICFAGVLICLRMLRNDSAVWITVVNHLVAALVCGILAWLMMSEGHSMPTVPQLITLFLFGSIQMGLPYLLMTRGLRTVRSQEAGTLCLLEPLLNPLWAWLLVPEHESLGPMTLLGGGIILSALAWRYWPRKGE